MGGILRGEVTALYRYPVKGLSPEPLEAVALTTGNGFPMDREFALARPGTEFDEARPEPLPKTRFVMLQRDEALAAVRSRYDDATGRLTLVGPGGRRADADLDTAVGRAEVERFVADTLGPSLAGQPRLVRSPGHRFTDVSVVSAAMMRAVSIINVRSVRDLAERLGRPIDPLRFRANIYVDGVPAWDELSWVGDPEAPGGPTSDREFCLGVVRMRAVRRTARCAATSVDPVTAVRDLNVPKALQAQLGHIFCGVYAYVLSSGELRPGDALALG